jgi:hypothetical protein
VAGQRDAAPPARLAAEELPARKLGRTRAGRGDEEHVREGDVGAEARVAERAGDLHPKGRGAAVREVRDRFDGGHRPSISAPPAGRPVP